MKKQIWLLPLGWQNFYIGKDVCQVPLQIKNNFNLETELVFIGKCFNDEAPYKEFEGINIVILNSYFSMVVYLFKNFSRIDIFGTFHFHRYSLFLVYIFSILNKRSLIILKSDISNNSVHQLISFKKNKFINLIINLLFNKIDIFTIESKQNLNLLKKNFPKYIRKFIYVSNGFYEKDAPEIEFEKKENNIIVIGLIGDKNKNHELLIKSLETIHTKEKWNIYFVGRILNEFDFNTNNEINNFRIHFTGSIYSKNELYKLLNKSKIFCHTSNFEGDPLVQYEAMYYGLFCVSTNCGTIQENYPDFFSNFSGIGNVIEYSRNLQNTLDFFEKNNNKEIKSLSLRCHEVCRNKYLWNKTTSNLINLLGK